MESERQETDTRLPAIHPRRRLLDTGDVELGRTRDDPSQTGADREGLRSLEAYRVPVDEGA